MSLKDRESELTFHKNFSPQDFETDLKVFKVLEEVFKNDKKAFDFITEYYFDLQKRAAKGKLKMSVVQNRLYATIVSNLDRKKAVALPKIIIKNLGARKGLQVIKFLRSKGLK